MYTFHSRVRYSEVDHREQITLPGIINYFQDCSIFHSESIGKGIEWLKAEGKAWVLSYWQVVVNRYPRLGEDIDVSTWATGFSGIMGNRNFQMTDGEGKTAAYANSIWTYMDIRKGRPVRPGPEIAESYGIEPALDMNYAPRKIKRPQKTEEKSAILVKRGDIDTNEHVNNCQYVQMALETLEKDIKVRQVRVEYKKSALYHDSIIPRLAREEGRIVAELCDREGNPYAVVEFIGEQK